MPFMLERRVLNTSFRFLGLSKTLFAYSCEKRLFVFNYHEISDSPSEFAQDYDLNVPPGLFRRQLQWIKRNFVVISPNDLLERTFKLPAAMITFDDGFASVFENGAPILKEECLSAVCFMNMAPTLGEIFWSGLVVYLKKYRNDFRRYIQTRYIGDKSDFLLYCQKSHFDAAQKHIGSSGILDEARGYYGAFADQADLMSSRSLGLFLGNHLYNHFNALSLPTDSLQEQYLLNEELLSQFPNYLKFFSYPFGQAGSCYSRVTDNVLFGLGALRIFTAVSLANRNPLARRLHRIAMVPAIDSEKSLKYRCIVSSLFSERFRYRKLNYV